MSDRETPLTDANVASLTKTPDCFCHADFARDLERKLAEAREALEAVSSDLRMELNERGVSGDKWCSLVCAREALACTNSSKPPARASRRS